MDPWKPELEVTPELASSLIAEQFPQLAPVDLVPLDSGWDNVVYQVNQKWFFRFPQREMAVAGVELEIVCLPRVAEVIGVVPKIQFFGTRSERYPWPFFGYLPVSGIEVTDAGLDPEGRGRLARPLGELLRKLHSGAVFDMLADKLPKDPLRRLDFSHRVPMTEDRLKKLEGLHQSLPYERLRELLHAAFNTPRLAASAVVHGDLHFRHVIVDSQGVLSGLIDWGDIHLNDPAADLQLYWSFLPPKARSEFANVYGPISETQLIQSRAFAVFVNIALLEYALSESRPLIEREARCALENLLLD